MKKIVKASVLLACLFMLSVPTVLAQDFCNGNFDFDGDVDFVDFSLMAQNWLTSEGS